MIKSLRGLTGNAFTALNEQRGRVSEESLGVIGSYDVSVFNSNTNTPRKDRCTKVRRRSYQSGALGIFLTMCGHSQHCSDYATDAFRPTHWGLVTKRKQKTGGQAEMHKRALLHKFLEHRVGLSDILLWCIYTLGSVNR